MNRNLLALALLLLAGGALGTVAVLARDKTYVAPQPSAQAVIPVALSGAVPPECEVRTLDVQGICCPGCGSKLYGKLAALDGVREVAVDPLKKEVFALVRRDVPNAELESALTFDEYVAKAR